ncbi:MAG: right-handed parallel beta-helix repeat-containing protein [Fimbriimonadales bacterium]|nr:right-handed parallel beta-helix repeat-containing protein [Fimbriimonadales bacterium]
MLAAMLAVAMAPTVLHVSPTGDDAGDGSVARPLRSLREALSRARASRVRHIRLLPGVHRVSETVVLGPEDKGLVLEGPAVLSGARVVNGWRRDADGCWSAPEPTDRPIRMLLVNGEIRPRARYPESGRLRHESVFDIPWMSTTGGGWRRPPTDQELTTLRYREGDLGQGFEPRNAEVTVFHMWDESLVAVSAIDRSTRTLVFASKLGHPAGAFGVQEYVVWNTREGLTRPGQWFHDRASGRIVVRPLPGERLDRKVVEAPVLETVLRLQDAGNVTIRNLILEGGDAGLGAAGFGAGDAEGTLSAYRCPGLTIERVTVRRTNNWGVRVVECPNARIRAVLTEGCGAGGIRCIGDGALVEDCRVERIGHLYPSAIGIWAAGRSAAVRNNHVADTPYSGIVGGSEGMLFEANLIERAMRVLHDGAGIYAGFAKNVTMRGNVVRDIADTGGYGAAAYYVDEQGEGFTVERNLSVGVVEASRNHMAKANILRENVFVNQGPILLTFARSSGYRLERNVAIAQGEVTLRAPTAAFGTLPMDALLCGGNPLVRVVLNDYSEAERTTIRPRDVADLGRLEGLRWRPSPELRKRGFPALDWSKVGPRTRPGCPEEAAAPRR